MPTNTQSMDYAGSSAPLLTEILTKVNNAKMKDDKKEGFRGREVERCTAKRYAGIALGT